MSYSSNQKIAELLLESLNQITNTAVSPRRTGGELEDSAMAAFIDQLNLSESEIYIGLKEVRERAMGKGGRSSDLRKRKEAQEHLELTSNLKQVLENGEEPIYGEATIFIKHPLGKQNWPEFALYHNGKVLPIEVKSSADGKIVWNGGLPRQGCLYVYFYTKNKAEGKRASIFFGEDIISPEVYGKLRENHDKVQKFVKDLHQETFKDIDDMGFCEYARAMFNHKVKIHHHPKSGIWQSQSRLRIAKWAEGSKDLIDDLKLSHSREMLAYRRKQSSQKPPQEKQVAVKKRSNRP